ncbi:MFS transporter [Tepidibacillus fermentans]|uniref:EmrB/QacA subfamily drug resistance transporter n=1 Tax=Tepidibacillus fermentans TaxID=1281767 RepID=A0A4R3KLE9_9BACI|nr:MFS transporter [Tepidibacillus fermentans]TCS84432.1 EmrB/QacA subfamily drug resistance transporter [Tepidibacillus fermentans]
MGKEASVKQEANSLSRSKQFQILSAVAIGTFMGPLDSSVVNIALPEISQYFHASLGTVEWVVMSYLLVISSLLLTYGRLGDMYGHKKIYTLGFVIFTLGSLLNALSPNILSLIFFRAVQAIGAGMMMSMGPAIITDIAPPNERGKFMGVTAVSVSVALATGPVLGGFLTTHFGWPSIFYINLPIGIIGYIWANRVIPQSKRKDRQQFDILGALILFLALISILFSLSYTEKWGWKDPIILSLLALGLVFLFTFVLIEKRVKDPMVDLSIFQNRLFSIGNLSSLLSFIAQFSVILLMPFYLQQLRGYEPSQAGLLFIPMPLTTLIVAPISGIISDRIDARYISSLGMGITAFGLWQLSQLNANSSHFTIVIAMITIGLGSGMFQTPNNSAIMGSVPKTRLGIASSMLATMRNLGMVLGVAISGAIFTGRLQALSYSLAQKGLRGEELKVESFIGAMHLAFLVTAGLAVIAVFTSLIRGSMNHR